MCGFLGVGTGPGLAVKLFLEMGRVVAAAQMPSVLSRLRACHRGLWWQLPSEAVMPGTPLWAASIGFLKTLTIGTLKTSKIKFYFVVISKVDRDMIRHPM